MTQPPVNVTTIDCLKQAARCVKSIGDISAAFTSCVRSLIQGEHERTESSPFSFVVRAQLQRLVRSPTLLAHVYYAALSYFPDKFKDGRRYTPIEIAAFFTPEELGTVLASVFYHRKMVAILGDDWTPMGERMQLYCDIAFPLGQLIPSIGSQRGLLVSAGRYLGWGTIAVNDRSGFKKYRVDLKVNKKIHDFDQEVTTWGTTHCHIATNLFQSFGIGRDLCSDYLSGLMKREGEDLVAGEVKFRVAEMWMNSLIESGKPPEVTLGDDFEIAGENSQAFEDRVLSIIENGSPHNWLTRTRTDLSPEKSPFLDADYKQFERVSTPSGVDTVMPDYLEDEVPA